MRSHILVSLMLTVAHGLPEFALSRTDQLNDSSGRFARRASYPRVSKRTIDTNVFNVLTWSLAGAYYLNITVGTPPSLQTVLLATAASDLYFDGANADDCSSSLAYSSTACRGGSFNHNISSSYQHIAASPAFNSTYGDGSYAVGPLGSDIIGIGNTSISGVEFAIGEDLYSTSGNNLGVLGLAYYNLEAVALEDQYPNLVESMVNAGVIDSRLYSVHLGSTFDTSGSILFGGIDTSKYTGPLVTLNILPDVNSGQVQQTLTYPIVTITDAALIVAGQSYSLWAGGSADVVAYNQSNSQPILLDTGSTGWWVPPDVYSIVQAAFPQSEFPEFYWNNNTCSCKYASAGHILNMTFGGKIEIQFDASEFIVPLADSTTKQPTPWKDSGYDTCLFLILNNTDGIPSFGNPFLRNMYVVYDLDNGQVSIAQALLGDTGPSNVIPVSSGVDGLANAAPTILSATPNSYSIPTRLAGSISNTVSALSQPIGTATGVGAVPTAARASLSTIATPPAEFLATLSSRVSTSTSTASLGSSKTPNPQPRSNTGAIAGGVVGGVAGLVLIGALILFLFRKRRQSRVSISAPPPSYEFQHNSPEMHQSRLSK